MESRAAWDAENTKALEELRLRCCALERRCSATETSPPSPYGSYVDAVAKKGFWLAVLGEIARMEAKVAGLKARLSAGFPEASSPCSHCRRLAG
jgi:hypothetical protein